METRRASRPAGDAGVEAVHRPGCPARYYPDSPRQARFRLVIWVEIRSTVRQVRQLRA